MVNFYIANALCENLQGPGLQNDIGKLIYFFSLEFLLVPQRLGAFEVAATPDVCL